MLKELESQGHRVTAVPTAGPGTASGLARQSLAAGSDLMLALGGDGTLNEVANGMVGSHVPLGVLPAGTANVLARELRLPCDTLAVARRVRESVTQRISVGLLRSDSAPPRYFLLMAGVGFDAHIVYRLNLALKARLGQLAYWVSAAKELVRLLDEFEVQAGERSFRCSFALASRVRNYAGYLQIARGANILGNDFELVIFEGVSTLRYYSVYLAAVLGGRLARTKGITVLRLPDARFSAPPGSPVHVQVDGEHAGRLPASVEIVPDALTILAPPEFLRVF